jgi:hypothetical protein
MELGFAFSGTKGRKGQALILKRKIKEEIFDISQLFNDSRIYFNEENISCNGDKFYSIKVSMGYKILSKYLTLLDGTSSRTGYIASHVLIPLEYSIMEPGLSLKVLDDLLQKYIDNYVSNNKIKDEIEDPYVFEDITDIICLTKNAVYEKVTEASSTQRGHISFENHEELSLYFDSPYRKKFTQYDEVVLVEKSKVNMLINLGQPIPEPPKAKTYSFSFSPHDNQSGIMLDNATISLNVDGGSFKEQNEQENLFEGQVVTVKAIATGYNELTETFIAGHQYTTPIQLKLQRKTFTLSITIVDDAKRKPIKGAKVSFNKNYHSHTDNYGKVSFGDLTDAGSLQISFSQKGYETKIQEIFNYNFENKNEMVVLKKNKPVIPPESGGNPDSFANNILPIVLLSLLLLVGWFVAEYNYNWPFGIFETQESTEPNNPETPQEKSDSSAKSENQELKEEPEKEESKSSDESIEENSVKKEEILPVLANKNAIEVFSNSNIDITQLGQCQIYLSQIKSTYGDENKMLKAVKDIRGKLRQYEYVLELISKHQSSFNESKISDYKKDDTLYKKRHQTMIEACKVIESSIIDQINDKTALNDKQREDAKQQIQEVLKSVKLLDNKLFRDKE